MNPDLSGVAPGRPLRRSSAVALAVAALAVALFTSPAAAALPPLGDADWAARAPAAEPNAPLLVLFKRAEVKLMDLARQDVSSSLHLEQRLKVLTAAGLQGGELELAHSNSLRLLSLRGRTVLPGGREIPLPSEAKFERRLSRSGRSWVTAVVFPGVEVGAIVEYEAELRFDSILLLEPWFLSEGSPVLYSEVVFEVPKELMAGTWGRDPFQVGIETEKTASVVGTRLRAWARNLPSVPDEPLGPPAADLASQYGLLTTAWGDEYSMLELFTSWKSTCRFFDERYYGPARHADRGVKEKSRAVVGKLAEPRQRAEALYRFVRDEIRTEEEAGVGLAEGTELSAVLAEGSGDYAEKAVLLREMLDYAGLDARLVWANERSTGLPVMDVPSPAWFERLLVAVELPAGRVFLEPGEVGLPFGALPAELEGGQAILFDTKKPEVITLPALPMEANRRAAKLRLAIDGEGRAAGTGELVFAGQHGFAALAAADAAERVEHWTEYLRDGLPGFRISEVTIEAGQGTAEGELHLRWAMAQPLEEVLGDELTINPSRPLGPVAQVLTLPPAQRRTPVVLSFADRDEVDLELTYPEGWRVEARPQATSIGTSSGSMSVEFEDDQAARVVRYRRRLDVTLREGRSRDDYVQLRALYDLASKHDAQALSLVLR